MSEQETPIERIVEGLDHVRKSGGGYSARCPAHDDRNNSLSVSEGQNGRVLVKCHAGCETEDIVAALGLTMRDLFSAEGTLPRPRMRAASDTTNGGGTAATYSYHDAEGTLLYEVVRTEPKQFRQRRPDGRGGYAWNLDGVPRVLYRLPQLARADAGATVFITEGEKDADNLDQLGLVATTACGGAGKWREDYSDSLRDRNVVILPDNDGPGHSHAEQVAQSLQGIAASVRVLALPKLPPKGDVSDWLAVGHTTTELVCLVEATPLWTATTPRVTIPTHAQPPPPLHEAALYGLAGEIVAVVGPSTEADPVALLLNLQAAVANIIGDGPHWLLSGTKHSLRIYPVLVGGTGKGRKGTSWGSIRQVLKLAAPEWVAQNVKNGLSSGEGLIHHVRDPQEKQEPVREGNKRTGPIIRHETVIADAGVADKRLFVIESEFASVLKMMRREGNTLSPVIRQAWDGDTLQTLIKHSPDRATNPHVTILGHITKEELLRHLNDTEAANGLANRFLWAFVQRSKLLPHGGIPDPDVLKGLAERLRGVFDIAKGIGRITMDVAAMAAWERVYERLSDGRDDLVGAILGRAEAQVKRLAALYAVFDGTDIIALAHLEAALALWDYLEASAEYIFGDKLGDQVADTILTALRASEAGLTQTEISHLFSNNQDTARIAAALSVLHEAGNICQETRQTNGRPATIWRAI